MTARDAAFTEAVMAATSLCPRVVRAVARAKYANQEWRQQRLAEARALLRELDGVLDRAEVAAAIEAGIAKLKERAPS
ncbi:MAG TPA: hypothetical protein VNW24_00290 [Stellaceae bacterium]|jgi:hypothetical protein|nr:hypothetical protein [Stellaceae bacterium]